MYSDIRFGVCRPHGRPRRSLIRRFQKSLATFAAPSLGSLSVISAIYPSCFMSHSRTLTPFLFTIFLAVGAPPYAKPFSFRRRANSTARSERRVFSALSAS